MSAQFFVLFDPYINHPTKLRKLYPGDREIVLGRKTNYPANTGLALGHEQPAFLHDVPGSVRKQSGIVVVKNKRSWVFGIAHTGCPDVSRAHIALGVVGWLVDAVSALDLSEPGTLRAVR